MVRGVERARTAARLPIEAGRLGVRAMRWSGEQMMGRTTLQLLGVGRELALGSGDFARRLEATLPLSEARQGAEDVVRGLREGDPELTNIGGRNYTRSMVSASRNPRVSDKVTGQVIDMKDGLPVDPLDSPFLQPELAEEARGIIKRFGHGDDLPPAAD